MQPALCFAFEGLGVGMTSPSLRQARSGQDMAIRRHWKDFPLLRSVPTGKSITFCMNAELQSS